MKIESDKDELRKIFEDIENYYEEKEFELFNNSNIEENFLNNSNIEIIESHLNRKIKKNKRIVLDKADSFFLSNNNENIVTSFKINEKSCFSYYDKDNKKMRYAEISNGTIKEFEFKDMKIYYLEKKTKRQKENKK